MLLSMLFALVAAASDTADWFAVRINSIDSGALVAHDRRSGLVVRVGSFFGMDRARLELRRSPRLTAHNRGRDYGYTWEFFALSDPAADVKALARDIGQSPPAGSEEEALLAAGFPPPECAREMQYFVLKGRSIVGVLTAVPCTDEQRARLLDLLHAYVSGNLPPESAHRDAFDSISKIEESGIRWLSSSPSAADVVARFGSPFQVWPRYPDGFSLVYDASKSIGDLVAVDFGRARSVIGTRVFHSTNWGTDPPTLDTPLPSPSPQ